MVGRCRDIEKHSLSVGDLVPSDDNNLYMRDMDESSVFIITSDVVS